MPPDRSGGYEPLLRAIVRLYAEDDYMERQAGTCKKGHGLTRYLTQYSRHVNSSRDCVAFIQIELRGIPAISKLSNTDNGGDVCWTQCIWFHLVLLPDTIVSRIR